MPLPGQARVAALSSHRLQKERVAHSRAIFAGTHDESDLPASGGLNGKV